MDKYWSNKKVLVTGADGFIGSHLTEMLTRKGADVRAFVYYNSFGNWGWLEETPRDVLQHIDIFPGDIRDRDRVSQAIHDRDIVFHLASLIAIPYSYHAPDSYVETNIGGAMNVLNACRAANIDKLIHTSTSEVYGSALYVPIDEKHPMQGQSPYSASKIGADYMAMSFYNSFELPVVTARPFNTYGPRQSARAVIPTILSQLYQGVNPIKLGTLTPTRDFNYVVDSVEGFLAIAQCDKGVGEVINIGSGEETSIADLVQMLIKITGKNVDIISDVDRLRPENSEVNRLLCDATKLRELTGWKPGHSLQQGLETTAQWIEKNLHHFKPSLYNL